MAGIGIIVIIFGAIVGSMVFASYMYLEYQPNFILVESGQPVQVGPVMYTIEPLGIHDGDSDTKPEGKFFQIQIYAENLDSEETRMGGGQFYLLDESDKKFQAVYGNFTDMDLFADKLQPNMPATWVTQFDIPYDEEMTYRIGILPTKVQASRDIGIICVQNC
ncbi:MAG: hypothetical protein V3V83_00025 [Nitrosopumilaceae archaeon]